MTANQGVGGGPRDGRAAGPGAQGGEHSIDDRTMPGSAPPAFSDEPIRPGDDWSVRGWDGSTSRDGNWPASIGKMGGGR